MTRLELLQDELERPLLVSAWASVRYLCGLSSSNTALVIERERARLFTDSRYTAAARRVSEIEVVEVARDVFSSLGSLIDGEIAFAPEDLTVAEFEKLKAGGLSLQPLADDPVLRMRARKDPEELDAVRHAASITNAAYSQLASEPFRGRSESELAWRMAELFHELGADGEAFPTIVATGPNGALPHAEPGERVVKAGDLVVVDAGAHVDGYCADCTRTFAAGEPSDELRRAYEVCLAAQETGLAALATGTLAREVDAAARSVVEASEFAGHFRHGLGHGVGIDVHEAPWLSTEAGETRLESGNVVTVEPGIYLEDVGGIRIEDLVIVGAHGIEVLTTTSKQLRRVG